MPVSGVSAARAWLLVAGAIVLSFPAPASALPSPVPLPDAGDCVQGFCYHVVDSLCVGVEIYAGVCVHTLQAVEDTLACNVGCLVDVEPTSEAHGSLLSVSVTGNASGAVAASAFGSAVGEFAASGMGSAHAPPGYPAGPDGRELAVSGTGDATACSRHAEKALTGICLAASGTGDAQGVFALSGTGDAAGVKGAASATGHASGTRAVSGCDLAGLCLP